MRSALALTVGVIALSALASAQGRGTQPSAPSEGQRYVAIGCISRAGTTAAPRYALTDTRGDRPTAYRLTGDATLLAQHVGHTVEATGSLTPAPPARGAAAAAQPSLKVDTIVWLASSCSKG